MRSVPVISKKHSSMENFSTTGAYRLQISIKAREQALYKRKSGFASTSWGHFCRAAATGSPVVTWNALAGMDFARMTPVRLSRSPPMAEGISRRSASPRATRRAASQDR